MADTSPGRKKRRSRGFPTLHPRAAGVDVGARFHVAAVPPALSPATAQVQPRFPADGSVHPTVLVAVPRPKPPRQDRFFREPAEWSPPGDG